MPPIGRLRIALFEPRAVCCWTPPFTFVGGYRLAVVPFDPGPENVPASFALGDTVRGEAIAPTGDVDEFTSAGTPGETLTVGFRLVQDAVPSGAPITLEVVDPATRAVLTYADESFNTILELGFASSIRKEWEWRLARGESTRNLEAFRGWLESPADPP